MYYRSFSCCSRGAKEAHNLTVDWIGDWNETPVDWAYNCALRAALDAAGFQSVRVASRSIPPRRGGQSGFVWLPARTMHSHGAYAW